MNVDGNEQERNDGQPRPHDRRNVILVDNTQAQVDGKCEFSDVSDTFGQPYGLGLWLQAWLATSGCFGMPNIPTSCASVSLFSFRYFHAARRYTTSHIVHTRLAPTPDSRAVGSSCGVTPVQFSRPTGRPIGGNVHTIKYEALRLLSRSKFWREQCFFSKAYSRLSFKALFDCISSIGRDAQKVNNQF